MFALVSHCSLVYCMSTQPDSDTVLVHGRPREKQQKYNLLFTSFFAIRIYATDFREGLKVGELVFAKNEKKTNRSYMK
jgi:hypothetical protein